MAQKKVKAESLEEPTEAEKHDDLDVNSEQAVSSKVRVRDEESESEPASVLTESPLIPSQLPILPLRGIVVYPHTPVPILIGQPRSIKLIEDVVAGNRLLGLVASRDPELELPDPEDLYRFGTASSIHRLFRAPDGTFRLVVQGLARFELGEFIETEPYLKAEIHLRPETVEEGVEIEAQMRAAKDQFQRIVEIAPSMPGEILASVLPLEDPLQVAYSIANYQSLDLSDAQGMLEEDSTLKKLQKLNSLLSREVEVLSLGQQIQQEARTEIEKVQREYFLREQLKAIQRELGETDEQGAEVEEFRKRIDSAGMPEEAEKQARRELDRLARLPTAAAEYGVIRTYLDWLVTLPWSTSTDDNLDLENARRVLDEDHHGLEDVKERILEFMAIRKLRQERQDDEKPEMVDEIRLEREGVILCFVGPPGVGKTSLGRSIARAIGRKFIRASLGGVHDEAEIRGHRRTYIGAMPGRIIQALRRAESNNPVFMLDEVDKLGSDFRGDPSSALLEVLDPEQNREFRDNYLDVPFDLSQVMFIATANWLESVPPPLRDRMEVIHLAGYTEYEKAAIARGYLLPRQIRENGLRPDEIQFSDGALQKVIREYTREAGVRNLEREIGSICRKVAVKVAEGKENHLVIDKEQVAEYLGKPRFYGMEEIVERVSVPGVAAGLSWTPTGGEVLFIEATAMQGGRDLLLTGSLGDVMKESAQAALSYVRSKSNQLKIAPDYWGQHDIHIHVPAGAQPKDGPSAGVTIAAALASLTTGRPVRSEVGMTGEITLRGKVLPVGGIKEKVLAAARTGLKQLILPKRNELDLDEVPDDVRKNIEFVFVDTVDDVLKAALESGRKPARRRSSKPAAKKPPAAKAPAKQRATRKAPAPKGAG